MRRAILVMSGAAILSIIGAQRVFCADVAGLVLDTQARPVPNVTILVRNLAGKVLGEAHSDASGRYRVTGLVLGTYNYVLDPAASGFKAGDAVSYLGPEGLTINWRLSVTTAAIALARDGTGTMLAGDPFGFSLPAFAGLVAGSSIAVGGIVVGSVAAAGGFSGSPASPSL